MMQTMKWVLPLGLLFCTISAGAQQSTTGYTTLEYDVQENELIATCTMDSSYSTQAFYGSEVKCYIEDTATGQSVAEGDGETTSTIYYDTPSAGTTYVAWGFYALPGRYYNIEYLPTGYFAPDFMDPFDYSVYGDNQLFPANISTWHGDGPSHTMRMTRLW
jgi:hypothetical protein